ncbi:MAG: fibronectin type III domain-containing protein [Treponema sp.]|nr:fibronectin type III domain-containing protein [Treponema sp.]
MRNKPFILAILYSFFLLPGSTYGIGEKTITLGSTASWGLFEKRQGIIEASNIRPQSVLVLASSAGIPYESKTGSLEAGFFQDLHLSFDERNPGSFSDSQGHYDVTVSPSLSASSLSRVGTGAAMFTQRAGDEPIVLKPRRTALFAPGSHIRDFSIEFWLFPQNTESGEQILFWSSSKSDGQGAYFYQRIQCITSKNRLQWTFVDFFFSPGERARKTMSLMGTPVIPRTWSHHLVRFDADLGLLEYLVDGKVEAMEYTTVSGREGGDVYTPVIGEDCRLVLGGRFSGMMDEFRIYRHCLETPVMGKYSMAGGRIETRTMDLGHTDSQVLKIEAFGGRTETPRISNAMGQARNEYAGNSRLSFSDHSEMRFFIRVSNSSYRWNDVPWVPINPGVELAGVRGRYIQLAADFYPGWNGETSPYLSELNVIYKAAEPPPPPTLVTARARDGAVELSWRASPSREVGGYLVYYGTTRGEYFGNYAIIDNTIQVSPINTGNRTSIRIEGLKNGTLYYFAVAAYGSQNGLPEPGEFSREAAARPLLRPEDG